MIDRVDSERIRAMWVAPWETAGDPRWQHPHGSDKNHPTVAMTTTNGETVDVDEGIADLVQTLWRRHWPTYFSCEEQDPGVAYVQMSLLGAMELWDAVATGEGGARFMNRAVSMRLLPPATGGHEVWRVGAHVARRLVPDLIERLQG